MTNPWLEHVKRVRKKHPSKSYKDVLKIAKKTYRKGQHGSGFFNDLINKIPSSDKTGRPRYPGEKHAILKLGTFKTGIANYMGPGTAIIKRSKRRDPPRSFADGVSAIHDIDLTLSGGDPSKVRQGDLRMISKLDNMPKGKDYPINVKMGKWAISAKVKAEDLGMLNKGSFGISKGNFKNLDPRDISLLQNRRKELVQQGYGRVRF